MLEEIKVINEREREKARVLAKEEKKAEAVDALFNKRLESLEERISILEEAVKPNINEEDAIERAPITVIEEIEDKYRKAMDQLFSIEGSSSDYKFKGLRDGYTQITQDLDVSGFINKDKTKVDPEFFPRVFSETLDRYLKQWYNGFEQNWRKIVRVRRGIQDFRPQEMLRVGGFGNLKVFEDTIANPEWANAIEIECPSHFKPKIRAKMFTITEQMIKNDDMFIITRMLEESARAADETLSMFVYSLLIGGSQYLEESKEEWVPIGKINTDRIFPYHDNGDLLYTLRNGQSLEMNTESLKYTYRRMTDQKSYITDKPLLLNNKKYLVIPFELEELALEILEESSTLKNIEVIALDKLYLGNSKRNWYLIEDPKKFESVQLGFVDDEEDPRAVLANNPTVGRAFTHGGLQFTISHRYGGGVSNPEGLFGNIMY